MAKIKLPSEKVVDAAEAAQAEEPQVASPVPQSFQDRIPSNWEISPGARGMLSCHNTVSGERFEGSVEEFNRRMRGD